MSRVHYGDDGTIHRTGVVNVEVDKDGNVVSVWFRCMLLPFTAREVNERRAVEMEMAYKDTEAFIHAIDLEFPPDGELPGERP